MILIDRREAKTNRVASVLRALGLQVSTEDLAIGGGETTGADFAFEGNGPDGRCMIGIERKRIHDMISSICNGRFSAKQLPGILQMYKFSYLIVEGAFRPNQETGLLEIPRGQSWFPLEIGSRRIMYREYHGFVTTLEQRTPMRVHRSVNPQETAHIISCLYHWWNAKPWLEHRAHQAFYQEQRVEIFRASLLRRVAKELFKIGWGKSKAVDAAFESVHEAVNADVATWMKIPGIGKTIAERIVKEIRGTE